MVAGFGAFSEEEGRDGDLGFFSPEHGRFWDFYDEADEVIETFRCERGELTFFYYTAAGLELLGTLRGSGFFACLGVRSTKAYS